MALAWHGKYAVDLWVCICVCVREFNAGAATTTQARIRGIKPD